MYRKHLSSIANEVLQRCAKTLNTSGEGLIEEFEVGWKPEINDYSRKLVEFCSSKALINICCNLEKNIVDGLFSRVTFDMMLAWERPTSADEESYSESVAKETEDKKIAPVGSEEDDDVPLFYSDLMPLLVGNEPSVGGDSIVWLGSLVPLVVDVANGRFTFEALTASTANRLHYPAYDRFITEVYKCSEYLKKQATPNGISLRDDEFILHVDGTATTQRVIRHIGGTSWPGRLTLTNYALYFEASGVVSYEDALEIDLSKDVDHSVRPASTGPWGAPLFDKAIIYESTQLKDNVVLEFPEMTSSTRRDLWLALIKEIILLHRFLLKHKIESQIQAWEMHARTILGILRVHAAREMLRLSPPAPTSFLIFSLFDELPKGDYVLEELANGLKQVNNIHPCSPSSILRQLNMLNPCVSSTEVKEGVEERVQDQSENLSSLDTTINQVREEAKEVSIAKSSVEGLKEEGISDSFLVLMELLRPLKSMLLQCQGVLRWERPLVTFFVLSVTLIVIYKEWIGKAIAASLVWAAGKMLKERHERRGDERTKIVVRTGSDQTTMETIVSAQHGLKSVQEMVQTANITILKIRSILVSRSPKHTNQVMMAMIGLAVLLGVVPFKLFLIILTLHCFIMNSKIGMYLSSDQGNRRLNEWWDSIPVVPVEVVDKKD
ncbi:uncharacterized protein LOC122652496 [Telopea speciosissima]|uniref:uncharacterized protein LOC122652496 n=1 Tax=Telopea speciosissima TaxID=54955 RepID=UPI001CC61BC6|nr:uncharacterized protein LOC122652496 [Telopea speciosissima]